MHDTIIDVINGMLAPGLMISACGLLLLGMHNKYSLVVNRIRTLNYEFRALEKSNAKRKESILTQLPLLIVRMRFIRNAVWLYTISIALFIFSIFAIGLFFYGDKSYALSLFAFTFFISALFALIVGITFAAKEVRLGYKILSIETQDIL
jgi:polyferredoxin